MYADVYDEEPEFESDSEGYGTGCAEVSHLLPDGFQRWLQAQLAMRSLAGRSAPEVARPHVEELEEAPSVSLRLLEERMRWTARTATNHNCIVSYLLPDGEPKFPFVLRYDPRSGIFAHAVGNILCVDIDEKDGTTKEQAAQRVRAVADKHDLKFRLYETDRGMHAYCSSKTFDWRAEATWSLMLEMGCDIFYIAFVAIRGFSMRLSPKPFTEVERRKPKSQDEFDREFVKRPWLELPFVGPVEENFALVKMIDFCYQLTCFLKEDPDLHAKLNNNLEHENLLRSLSRRAELLFNQIRAEFAEKNQGENPMEAWLAMKETHEVPYRNDVSRWCDCRKRAPGGEHHVCTKHPEDGKQITVFSCGGEWKYVHDNQFSRLYPTKAAAQQAVHDKFGNLQVTNIISREAPASQTAPQIYPGMIPAAAPSPIDAIVARGVSQGVSEAISQLASLGAIGSNSNGSRRHADMRETCLAAAWAFAGGIYVVLAAMCIGYFLRRPWM